MEITGTFSPKKEHGMNISLRTEIIKENSKVNV